MPSASSSPTPSEGPTPSSPSSTSSQNQKRPLCDVEITAHGRQKARKQDPLIAVGRHFARTIDMFTFPGAIINHGLTREDSNEPRSAYTKEENRMWDAYQSLDKMVPGLIDRLVDATSVSDVSEVAKHLKLGGSKARSDDTNGLKKAVVEWVHDIGGETGAKVSLNSKTGRGFYHPVFGRLLCPAMLDWDDEQIKSDLLQGTAKVNDVYVNGSHWPNFLYEGSYNKDIPWVGLLRGDMLVKAFKHIFTSPSSVANDDGDSRSTRSGNAQLNGMTRVTPASIAYVATQVQFALSSQSTFSKTSKVLDSTGLYNSICDYFDDPDFAPDVEDLLAWWNRRVFPEANKTASGGGSASLDQLKAARAAARSQGPALADSTNAAR